MIRSFLSNTSFVLRTPVSVVSIATVRVDIFRKTDIVILLFATSYLSYIYSLHITILLIN